MTQMQSTDAPATYAAIIEAFEIADQRTINLGDLRALTGMNLDEFADAITEAYEDCAVRLIALADPTEGDRREAVEISGSDRHLARLA